ncbi:MAG: serine--tRNA ligase [Pseudobdellovibrionaceae bacterium]
MHDIKALRETPEKYDANWARRGLSPQTPELLALDKERRAAQTELQAMQQARGEKSKEIGMIKSKGGNADALMAEVAALKEQMSALEEKERELGEALDMKLASIPNLLADDTPDGKSESDNVEVGSYGTPKNPNADVPDHQTIGEALGLMDFEAAAKISGARFVFLKGALARMERALAQFMLDTQTGENGYTEVSPPLLVRDNALYGTGQLPKFAEDLFKTTTDHWLIPTAEVSLTNMVYDEILDVASLPRRYTAFTPCFRSEAGSAGRDTRGMIRQHQFYKVELVSITLPDQSEAEHERMTKSAESILEKLELPYRRMALCAGDIGFGAMKTYDLEVWVPSQKTYREISSCSNCGDFQARRMNARTKIDGEKGTSFVHTLNGSGLAVGRTLVAVIENYYDPADGSIFVPKALQPYMGGLTKITKV